MGECTVNLAKVKEAVIQLVDNPADTRPLEQAKPQLRGIAAGLLMLDKTKAVTVVERVGTVIAHAARRRHEAQARVPRAARRRDRQRRVLPGDGQRRPHRSVVHARQRGALPRPARKPCRWRSRRRRPCRARPQRGRAAPAAREAEGRCTAAERDAGRGGPLRSRARRGVHRGGQGRDREHPAQPAACGPPTERTPKR